MQKCHSPEKPSQVDWESLGHVTGGFPLEDELGARRTYPGSIRDCSKGAKHLEACVCKLWSPKANPYACKGAQGRCLSLQCPGTHMCHAPTPGMFLSDKPESAAAGWRPLSLRSCLQASPRAASRMNPFWLKFPPFEKMCLCVLDWDPLTWGPQELLCKSLYTLA